VWCDGIVVIYGVDYSIISFEEARREDMMGDRWEKKDKNTNKITIITAVG